MQKRPCNNGGFNVQMLEIIFFWILVSVYSFVLIYETREQYILDIKDREAGENPGYFFLVTSAVFIIFPATGQ